MMGTQLDKFLDWECGIDKNDLPREFVSDHLDIDLLAHSEPDTADEVLVDPWLKLTHPVVMR